MVTMRLAIVSLRALGLFFAMKLPVEDEYVDVIAKAQRGLGLSSDELARRAGISVGQLRDARKGAFDEAVASVLAKALNLNEAALLALGRGTFYPAQPSPIDGLSMICTPFHGYKVNSYLAWDKETGAAVAFDAGTDAQSLINALRERNLSLKTLFITHTHWDHVEGVDKVVDAYACDLVVNQLESNKPSGSKEIREGYEERIDSLCIRAIETTGHTTGGTTYLLGGLSLPVAFVGDALFAGSMGGANISYEASLNGLQRLMALEPNTVLASGHGPLSTVAQEREGNCYYST